MGVVMLVNRTPLYHFVNNFIQFYDNMGKKLKALNGLGRKISRRTRG